ncbi:2-nitropropane dioxygenase [Melampsora americana]|nr:2-nitropropane dioxygenase [Melampsora americana]
MCEMMKHIESDPMKLSSSFFKCRVPLISAPMAGVAGPELAAAVTLAGGFGFLGTGHERLKVEGIMKEIDEVKKELGTTSSNQRVSIGIGFLAWRLDDMEDEVEEVLKCLEIVMKHVKCIWLSFGEDLMKWIKLIQIIQNEHQECKLAIMISSLKEAQKLFNSILSDHLEIDILIGQGFEAGGHGGHDGESLNSLIPALKEMLLKMIPESQRPILVAAGGLTHGSHLAAMLALGASGIVSGTRFLATPEARYTDDQKKAILSAQSIDTIKTTLFDELRGTVGWPKGIDGRALKNQTTVNQLAGMDFDTLQSNYKTAMKIGDVNILVTWSGMSVGLISEILPAKKIVQEIENEAIQVIMAINRQISQ